MAVVDLTLKKRTERAFNLMLNTTTLPKQSNAMLVVTYKRIA